MRTLAVAISVMWATIFVMFLFGGEVNPITEGGAYAFISFVFAKEALGK